MKAIVCKEFGPPSALVYEEMEPLSPKKNEILIDIHAAGVNFPDTLIIKDMYQFKPALPLPLAMKLLVLLEQLVKKLQIIKWVMK